MVEHKHCVIMDGHALPDPTLPNPGQWLHQQPLPVIAVAQSNHDTPLSHYANADVVVEDYKQAETLARRIEQWPHAALVLVQVLRAQSLLPIPTALDVESLAFSTLQSGSEFTAWLDQYRRSATDKRSVCPTEPAILIHRQDGIITAKLNRPQARNSISVAMRDALIELLTVVALDKTVQRVLLTGNGPCFSVGGELAEFGELINPCNAHWVRTIHSPARLMAQLSERISCTVHGACIGSGIELPAFAQTLIAKHKTFFQLPELSMGLIPGAGGTVSISRRIGRHRTAWLVLSGKKISAKTALQWGLIDQIEG